MRVGDIFADELSDSAWREVRPPIHQRETRIQLRVEKPLKRRHAFDDALWSDPTALESVGVLAHVENAIGPVGWSNDHVEVIIGEM